MYPVSNDYKTAIAKNTVTSNWYGTITTTEGTAISFDRTNLDQNQSKITRQYTSGETLEIGNAFSNQLTLGLRGEYDRFKFYGAEIVLYFRLFLNDIDYEDVPCGTFVVSDASFTYNSVKLTAYDYMQKFTGKISALTDAEPYAALVAICTACGVTLGNTQAQIEAMVNGTVELPLSVLEARETYKNVVGYIAAILCGNAIIGVDSCLYIKQYSNTTVRTLTKSSRYSSTYIDYIGRYTTLALMDSEGNEETYTASGTFTETCLTMSIGTNPLLNEVEDRETMAQDIVDEIATIVYAPCTISMPQDPSLDIGDSLMLLIDDDPVLGQSVRVIITQQDIKLYGQTQIISAGGNYELSEARTRTEFELEQIPLKIADTEQKLQEEIKQITYDFLDPQVQDDSAISAGSDNIVLAFYFNLEEATRVKFGSTFTFETTATTSGDKTHLHVIYNVDGTELNPNDPLMEYYDDGWHILTLDFLTDELAAGSHSFGVAFGVTGGDLT